MKTKILLITLVLFLLTSCTTTRTSPTPTATATDIPQVGMANPASVYCVEQGFKPEIRTAADESQSGVCIFPDGSECEEWAYFRGECKPADSTPTQASASALTDIPTPRTIDPADYQGWWTYTHSDYGFSFLLPPDWVVDETTTSDPLMNGHTLMLHPQHQGEGTESLLIRLTFRRIGEDVLLWPTGVGAGQFVPQGTLDVAGQPARRMLFVCPTGQVNAIWYHGQSETNFNIQRGNMEFGLIFSLSGFYCQEGHSLGGKLQYVGEMIIASLKMP
jgi:putative hemolysin